ncbi:DUF4249 domain-containing protein [Maribacter sp. 2308TA10-17]|uniref:DUF4249 domain-containing protein n=1 Tax=Maribacter sp. 2308TA10-17 TaxID=3386276 RepID=UPI0039BC2899
MKKILYIILAFCVLLACIDPFEVETQAFAGVLVVDARLTNEVKQHRVLLSRARPFEQDSISPERNATVSIIENSGANYEFEETTPGIYISNIAFAGEPGKDYRLLITTANGNSYASNIEEMPENVPIASLSFERQTDDFGEDGVAVVLDNSSLGNQPRFFRYDYEENYKIVAPNWDPFEFDIIDSVACIDGDAFEVGIKAKNSLKGRICYGRQFSTNINLASTANLEDNNLSKYLIRFVNRENYILMHRYSILVKQYTQSVDAHSYYQDLESFSASESVFSETQPGFLMGNIISETNNNESVIGYFETAAISSKRIFFDYKDLFPDEPLPEYPITCSRLGDPRLIPRGYHCTLGSGGVCDGNCESPLINQIQANLIVFAGEKEPIDFTRPFFTLPVGCGDCTVLGSDIKPDFWID